MLLAVAVLSGAVAYVVLRGIYGSLPVLPRYSPVTLVVLAAVEGITAPSLRMRVRTRAIHNPLVVARTAALAKASSLVGALGFGLYGAVLIYTFPHRGSPQPGGDLVTSAFGAGASIALIVGALLLEYACRVPPSDDENRQDLVPPPRAGAR